LTLATTADSVRVSICHCLAYQRRTGSAAIPVGAFADSGLPAPTISVHEERRHPWVLLLEGIEHVR
jgi:hypothetical protein